MSEKDDIKTISGIYEEVYQGLVSGLNSMDDPLTDESRERYIFREGIQLGILLTKKAIVDFSDRTGQDSVQIIVNKEVR
mgnify:FL=1